MQEKSKNKIIINWIQSHKICFFELNIPLQGTASEDNETSKIYKAYIGPKSIRYVLEQQYKILEGAGIMPLKSFDDSFLN